MVNRSGRAVEAGTREAAREAAGLRPARVTSCSLSGEDDRVAALAGTEAEGRRAGARVIAGVDEVGRGALAGPVVAAAVVLDPRRLPRGLDDSKALLAEVRDDLARRVRRDAVAVGLGEATAREVDALGIAPATALAMSRALARLAAVSVDLVLVDGLPVAGLPLSHRAIVKGDARVAAIAAASVVAKVHRDTLLDELHARLPYYGFGMHRGYGTPEHLAALRRHGPSSAHRLTFDRVLPAVPRLSRRKAA